MRSAEHQDIVPQGFLRLDEALYDLREILKKAAGYDIRTGLPSGWRSETAGDDERRFEWLMRIHQEREAEQRVWEAITTASTLPLWSRPSARDPLARVNTALISKAETHRTLTCGRLMFIDERTAEHDWPLFLETEDWQRQVKAWAAELLPSSNKAEKDCERWLAERFSSGQVTRRGLKRALLTEARTEFPRLSERAFDRAWTRVAPAEFRKPGAPPLENRRT
jgi:hypothetical protein